jgi:hypothetical protein
MFVFDRRGHCWSLLVIVGHCWSLLVIVGHCCIQR